MEQRKSIKKRMQIVLSVPSLWLQVLAKIKAFKICSDSSSVDPLLLEFRLTLSSAKAAADLNKERIRTSCHSGVRGNGSETMLLQPPVEIKGHSSSDIADSASVEMKGNSFSDGDDSSSYESDFHDSEAEADNELEEDPGSMFDAEPGAELVEPESSEAESDASTRIEIIEETHLSRWEGNLI
ncbi:hypothetical protein Tco_1238188 [Tanacetum coccineum]